MTLSATLPARPRLALAAERPAPHLLDPLSAAERVTAVRIVRSELALPPAIAITSVALRRPSRELLAAWEPGAPFDREAVVVARDPALNGAYEVIVAVDDGFVRSFVFVPDVQVR